MAKATRGLTGFELAVSEQPDVIVLDLRLPGVDGFPVSKKLRSSPSTDSIPIVVLTGDDAAFARAKTTSEFTAVLMKPCPADRLLDAVHRALRK